MIAHPFLGDRRGQGLGTDATRLVLDFGFHVLDLRIDRGPAVYGLG